MKKNSNHLIKAFALVLAFMIALSTIVIFAGESKAEDTSRDIFGRSVADAGKLNDDDWDDVIIGSCSSESEGRVYIYMGYDGISSGLIFDQILTEPDEDPSPWFGYSVSGAGDVNGDGYDDIVIGCPDTIDSVYPGENYVYVYYGSEEGIHDDDYTKITKNAGQGDGYIGYSVSDAGDIDDDGYADIITGAPWGTPYGKAYVYKGIEDDEIETTPSHTLIGNSNKFGCSVSSAGNLNWDDCDDIIIGASDAMRDPFSETGAIYIYFGTTQSSMIAGTVRYGENDGDEFGTSVSNAGDVDNYSPQSGVYFDDVIVGAPGYGTNRGRAYIYYGVSGTVGVNPNPDILTGQNDNDRFGYSVSEAKNINEDDYDDVLVGAPNNAPSDNKKGKAYLFYGPYDQGMDSEIYYSTNSDPTIDNFGASVSPAGDTRDDELMDLLIGAPDDEPGTGTGRVTIIQNAGTIAEADYLIDGD